MNQSNARHADSSDIEVLDFPTDPAPAYIRTGNGVIKINIIRVSATVSRVLIATGDLIEPWVVAAIGSKVHDVEDPFDEDEDSISGVGRGRICIACQMRIASCGTQRIALEKFFTHKLLCKALQHVLSITAGAASDSDRKPEDLRRKAAIEADADAKEVEPHRIFCGPCNKWIGNSRVANYSTADWREHCMSQVHLEKGGSRIHSDVDTDNASSTQREAPKKMCGAQTENFTRTSNTASAARGGQVDEGRSAPRLQQNAVAGPSRVRFASDSPGRARVEVDYRPRPGQPGSPMRRHKKRAREDREGSDSKEIGARNRLAYYGLPRDKLRKAAFAEFEYSN